MAEWGADPMPWDLRRLKTVAELRTSNVDKNSSEDEHPVRLCNYTDVYYSSEIDDASEFMKATATPDEVRRFRLRRGDVLITKDSETAHDIAVPAHVARDFDDVLSGYHLAILRPNHGLVGKFLYYALLTDRVRDQFTLGANGITRFGLSQSAIKDVLVPVPDLASQRAIASFLDRETARIDTLIEKKRRLLDLLEEKRTALITQAVTRGLDPDVPMKHSGVDWIGEIPAHWEVARLGRLISRIDQGWSPVADDRSVEQGEVGVLKLSAIKRGRFFASEHKRLTSTERLNKRLLLREGDLLVTRSNTPELVGDACIVTDNSYALIPSDLVYRLQPKQDLLAEEFLLNWFLSTPHRAQLKVDARGSSKSMVKISQRHILNWVLPRPPREEQAWIVRRLQTEVSKIRAVSDRVVAAIDLLTEFRTALISAAVTGRIDVTESALTPA